MIGGEVQGKRDVSVNYDMMSLVILEAGNLIAAGLEFKSCTMNHFIKYNNIA